MKKAAPGRVPPVENPEGSETRELGHRGVGRVTGSGHRHEPVLAGPRRPILTRTAFTAFIAFLAGLAALLLALLLPWLSALRRRSRLGTGSRFGLGSGLLGQLNGSAGELDDVALMEQPMKVGEHCFPFRR